MPARTGDTILVPGKGVYNTRKKTYTGKGAAPAGSKKVAPKTISEVPVVTTSSSGQVTTSGFDSERAARRATRRQRTAIRTERRKTRALNLGRRSKALQRRNTSESKARLRSTEKAVRADSQRVRTAPKFSPAPKPASKPPKFEGRKTAGTPTQRSLLHAKRAGTLKVNQRGYLTTPAVRKTAATVRGIERQAAKRRSRAPLPGLDPEQAQVARTVLRRGEKARATSKEKLAGLETGLVESSLRNLSYGDADSQGWRQERTSIYGTGPKGPTNVPASADRFFREVRTDAGTSGAPTPGLLAQAAQGSAFPERYDERAPEAKAILRAYNKGRLSPAQQRKLKAAKGQAKKLGLEGLTKGKQAKKGRVPSVVYIGKQAEKKFGLHVGENPAFGGVEPVHVSGSYHYQRDRKGRGEAIDVSGDPTQMLAFDQWVARKWGKGVTELFYDPGTSIKEGQEIGPIGGHEDHVHVAVAMPGQSFEGGYTVGAGGAVFVGYGSSASAAAASSTRAIRAAGKGKARRVSPWQRYWRIKGRLKEVGAGIGEAKSAEEAGTSSTLAGLERKYGVKAG